MPKKKATESVPKKKNKQNDGHISPPQTEKQMPRLSLTLLHTDLN